MFNYCSFVELISVFVMFYNRSELHAKSWHDSVSNQESS